MADSVLIIDGDVNYRTILSRSLRSVALHTETSNSGEEGLERLWRVKYDLVVLDVELPGIDGFHLIQDVRRRGIKTPIVICSAHDEDYEQIYGLDIGADDYVLKPFNPVVFAAKARALIRRSRGLPMEDVVSAGPFTYNSSTLRFYKNGDEIVLSSKENAMIKLFMDNVDRVFRAAGSTILSGEGTWWMKIRSWSTSAACAQRLRTTPRTLNTYRPSAAWATGLWLSKKVKGRRQASFLPFILLYGHRGCESRAGGRFLNKPAEHCFTSKDGFYRAEQR